MFRTAAAVFIACLATWGQSFSFAPGVTYPAQQMPVATAAADFNGDGNLDLAVANGDSSSVSIFLGNGNGTFTAGSTVAIPGNCLADSLTAGDFTSDGTMDLLVVCGFQDVVWVLPGLGTGQFATPVSTTTGVYAFEGFLLITLENVAIADFNRDGKLDMALIASSNASEPYTFNVIVFLGNGDGTFTQTSSFGLGDVDPCLQMVTADFDGDGIPDLATATCPHTRDNTITNIQIYHGSGQGTFQQLNTFTVAGLLQVGRMIAADVNGDLKSDLVIATASGASVSGLNDSTLTAYLGNGDGTFSQGAAETEDDGISQLLAADFRGTGRLDLLEQTVQVPDSPDLPLTAITMVLRAGNGDGSFQPPISLPLPSGLAPWWFGMAVGNWAGSGPPGLAFTTSPSSTVFSISSLTDTGASISNLVANYAAMPAGDLVVINNDLTLAAGTAAKLTATSGTPQATLAGSAFAAPLQVTVTDGFANPVSGEIVTFLVPTSGPGATLSSTTAVTDSAGVATVTVTANTTTGNYSVLAGTGTLVTAFSLSNTAFSPCDANQDRAINVLDVQKLLNEVTATAPAADDVNADGVVNVVDVQIVLNAVLHLGCWAS